MDRLTKGILLYVIYWAVIQQGPHAYNVYNCVEPEPGYAQILFHYLTDTEIQKICPTVAGLIWNIVGDAITLLLSALVSQQLLHLAFDMEEEWWSILAAIFLGQQGNEPLFLAQRRTLRMRGSNDVTRIYYLAVDVFTIFHCVYGHNENRFNFGQ